MAEKSRSRKYSREFKQQVISDIVSGKLTRASARKKYDIPGHQTIDRWLVQNGHVELSSFRQKPQEEERLFDPNDPQINSLSEGQRKIAEMELRSFRASMRNNPNRSNTELHSTPAPPTKDVMLSLLNTLSSKKKDKVYKVLYAKYKLLKDSSPS